MIPPSTGHLQGAGNQAQPSRLDTSNQTAPLALKPGQMIEAKVLGAEKISAAYRAQLTSNIQKQLTELGAQTNTTGKIATAQHNNLLQNLQLLRSPQLLLVKIQYQQLQQLIYTDKPLQAGQSIPLQHQAGGKLALIATQPAPPLSTSASAQNATDQSLKSALITQALRQALPQQQPQNSLFARIKQIAAQPKAQQLLPPNTTAALNKLLQTAKTPEQLSAPQQLKNALQNSGLLLENKLAKHISSGQTQSPLSAPSVLSDTKALLAHALKATAAPAPSSTISSTLTSTLTSTPTSPPTSTATSPTTQAALGDLPSGDIKRLLQQIINHAQAQNNPQGQLNSKQLHTQLTLLLHQQLLSSMARIQVKQLQSLPQQGEQGLQSQALQLEIPIRWGEQMHNLELKIEEREADTRDAQQPSEKERQWQVTLSFDLLEHGHFHARLDIHGQHLKAKLWADNSDIFSAAQAQLHTLKEQLQDQGLLIDELNCQKGQPQQSSNRLSYQLVDIKT